MKSIKLKIVAGLLCAAIGGYVGAGVIGSWDFTGKEMPKGAKLYTENNKSGLTEEGDEKFLRIAPGSHKEYVEFDVADKADLPQKFTLEAVFRPSGTAGQTMVIGKRYQPQYQLDYTTGGDGTFEFYVGGGDSVKNRAHGGRFPADGRWYHLIAVFDSTASGNTQTLFINGKKVESIRNTEKLPSDKSPLRLAENSELNIGNPSGGDWQFAAIYDHAMSDAEAQQAYAKSAPGQSGKVETVSTPAYSLKLNPKAFSVIGGKKTVEQFFNRFTGSMERAAASSDAAGYTIKNGENGSIYLDVKGKVSKLHGVEWRNRFKPQLDLKDYKYFYAVVRSSGLHRSNSVEPMISAISSSNVVLLNTAEVIQDGHYRTYWKKVALDAPLQGIKLTTRSRNEHAFMEIAAMGFARTIEDIPQDQCVPGKVTSPFSLVQIAPEAYNWSLATNLSEQLAHSSWAIVDPLKKFPARDVIVSGIPFRVSTKEKADLIRTVDSTAAIAGQTQTVLGRTLNRNSYQPPSRNDKITLPVNRKGSELYFLMSTTLPAAAGRYALPTAPRTVSYVEAFEVKLYYADGTTSSAFPFQLKSDGYRVSGFFGTYMVPLNPGKQLTKVDFINKIRRHDFAIAAMTVNTSPDRRYPQAMPKLNLPAAPAEKEIAASACNVSREGQLVVMENSYYKMELDFSNGFAIKSLFNKLTGEQIQFAPGSGVAVQQNGSLFSGIDGKLKNLAVNGSTVSFTLTDFKNVPAEFQLAITGGESAQIKFSATMLPLADNCKFELRFPFFCGLKMGELADNGFLYPQYRNVLTTGNGFCLQPNHRAFTMQFFDLFNKTTGGGLLFMTDNLAQTPTWYGAGKGDSGMTGYIANNSYDVGAAKANTPVQLCDRSLTVHGGSWQRAASYYRNWVNSWYKPFNAQDKEKFLNAFYIHVTASAPCDAGLWPFLIDQKTKKYDVNAYLNAVSKQFNRKPDIFHFYWWSYRENDARNGEYSDQDYKTLIGSRRKFRSLINKLQKQNMLVSLYTIWDRYDRDTEFCKQHGDKYKMIRPDGTSESNSNTIWTGVGGAVRRDYAAFALNRLVKNVNNDIIYMDVFGTDWGERCVNPACGHKVPSWVAEDDGLFLKKLRETLPKTAVWSEYPHSDVNTQYIDGNITYTALPLNEHMAKVYNRDDHAPRSAEDMLVPDYYRFSFPKLKQVVFQVGQEGFIDTWAYMKFNLFNGYALYDTTFWLYFDYTRNNLAKTLNIQHAYKDCFLSDKAETLVPTLVSGVYANKFPGKGRTVWTFFNGNFVTVNQSVIALDYQTGDKFFDVWNKSEIKPVIKDGKAYIRLRLDPHEVGCIVRSR